MRIIRALEVYELSGKPISQLQKQWRSKKVRYTFSAFGLNMPRPGLYSRIEKRVDRRSRRAEAQHAHRSVKLLAVDAAAALR